MLETSLIVLAAVGSLAGICGFVCMALYVQGYTVLHSRVSTMSTRCDEIVLECKNLRDEAANMLEETDRRRRSVATRERRQNDRDQAGLEAGPATPNGGAMTREELQRQVEQLVKR